MILLNLYYAVVRANQLGPRHTDTDTASVVNGKRASVVNGKTSKKSMQKRRGVFGVSRPTSFTYISKLNIVFLLFFLRYNRL